MPKLSDIKDADGKEGLILLKKKGYRENIENRMGLNGEIIETKKSISYIKEEEGYNQAIEKQSQRQVAVEVDREKLAKYLAYRDIPSKTWDDWSLNQQQWYFKEADAIIQQKDNIFKVIYVKDA